jgi:hypothetical protein
MQGRDLFGVLVRAGGVTLMTFAFFNLAHLIGRLLDIDLGSHYSAPGYAFAIAAYLVPGFILLFCADWIVTLTYRGKQPNGENPTAGSNPG